MLVVIATVVEPFAKAFGPYSKLTTWTQTTKAAHRLSRRDSAHYGERERMRRRHEAKERELEKKIHLFEQTCVGWETREELRRQLEQLKRDNEAERSRLLDRQAQSTTDLARRIANTSFH